MLSINAQGLITVSPTNEDVGTYNIEILIENQSGDTRSQTISLEVKNINENLDTDLLNAPLVAVDRVVEPIKTIITNGLYMVPNADHQSWDLLQVYFKTYGGPNEIVVVDTGSNEVKHLFKDDKYMQMGGATIAIAPNGKLYMATLVRPGLQPVVNVYDPVTNKMIWEKIVLPSDMDGEYHALELGTDGDIYSFWR